MAGKKFALIASRAKGSESLLSGQPYRIRTLRDFNSVGHWLLCTFRQFVKPRPLLFLSLQIIPKWSSKDKISHLDRLLT